MRKYEVAVLLHPDLEIDQAAAVSKIEKLINEAGGQVLSSDDWGKRKLAYPINHQSFAIYLFYQVELPAENVGQLENSLRIADEVLRHLVVTQPEVEVAVSAPAEEVKEEEKVA